MISLSSQMLSSVRRFFPPHVDTYTPPSLISPVAGSALKKKKAVKKESASSTAIPAATSSSPNLNSTFRGMKLFKKRFAERGDSALDSEEEVAHSPSFSSSPQAH